MLAVYDRSSGTSDIQIWRLCFFLAGLPVIWWIGRGFSDLAVWLVERSLFTVQNAL